MSSTDSLDIREWIEKSAKVLIKKLSRNDCGWADGASFGHQNGVYIPRDIRESNFFPALQNINSDKAHIFEAALPTLWPSTGEIKSSKLKHYSNKGTEMHFTGVPREEFSQLTPASLLIGGLLLRPIGESCYWFMVIDSASTEAEMLESNFDLSADFQHGLFEPKLTASTPFDETELLIKELLASVSAGSLSSFIASVCKLPPSEVLALQAQDVYLKSHDLDKLDPYVIANPGDAIMQISRDIEYSLYKRAELRHRAAEVIRIITSGGSDVVTAIVRGFPELDATFLSASQHRKSRAGRSFERHIARLLNDGGIQFEEQAVTGGRRPDFVLPSLAALNNTEREYDGAVVLSAKTTLRERWKQLAMEKFDCGLFLATVDDRISSDAIDDMSRQEITLVVPESLKKSKETCYKGKGNVITFREFFDDEISKKHPTFRILS